MQLNDTLICAPAIEDAIDRHPLIVTPDTPLVGVIALMSQTQVSSCSLPRLNSLSDSIPTPEAQSSCVLVMQGAELVGIFTERDIVQLTAAGMNFEAVSMAEVMAQPVITLPLAVFQDIFAALFLFRRYRIRHLPVMDDQDQLVRIVSPESIRQVLRPANLLKLRRVSDLMTTQVIHAPLTASVQSLAELMAEHRVSCVVITEGSLSGGCQPVGIVTERDIVQFQFLQLSLCDAPTLMLMHTV